MPGAASPETQPESLAELLTALRPDAEDDRLTIVALLERIGSRSFAAVILVPAIMVVSPLSGVPSVPTLSGLLVLLIALQALMGRRTLWLPRWLTARSVSAKRLTRALDWLARPAAVMDRYSHDRLGFLVRGPQRRLAFAATALVAASWPVLEFVPFITSFFAGAVAMMMYGLMVRDGLYTLWGYIQGALLYVLVIAVWSGLV